MVIEALVSLSRRIGARTLGEGVETLDDLTMLAELDVDYAQGWAIGRPDRDLARTARDRSRLPPGPPQPDGRVGRVRATT